MPNVTLDVCSELNLQLLNLAQMPGTPGGVDVSSADYFNGTYGVYGTLQTSGVGGVKILDYGCTQAGATSRGSIAGNYYAFFALIPR